MTPGLIAQKDGSYAISIELPETLISASVLKVLAELADQGAKIHPTTAQKILVLGLSEPLALRALEQLEGAGALIRKSGKSLQPRTCVGKPYCKIALKETFPLSKAIYQAFPAEDLPHKFKVAVSGCPACCSWANLIDLGFVGSQEGFKLYIGGKGGYRPQPGLYLTTVRDEEEALSFMKKILSFFRQKGQKKRRLGSLLEKEGLLTLKVFFGILIPIFPKKGLFGLF
jgi:dissimilatory sulfite reductase (desulfoviridin) alpha/beta subunit